MAQVSDFFVNPSEDFLDRCTKEQLFEIAEHYKIDIGDKRRRVDTVKLILIAQLEGMEILPLSEEMGEGDGTAGPLPIKSMQTQLSFAEQKELMLIQLEMERTKQQIEMEKLRQTTEQARINLQLQKVELVKEGKMDQRLLESEGAGGAEKRGFDLVGSLRLMPKFNEKDPETFFSLFERLAEARGWPEADRTVMLQCVLTGKAQEAYSALSVTDCLSYATVKAAVLKAYELVPESYRQRFRNSRKDEKQSYLEFSRELVINFNRWRIAAGGDTCKSLCELMMLEQFKNAIPNRIATYVTEQQVKTVAEAAALADQYVLTHREWSPRNNHFTHRENTASSHAPSQNDSPVTKIIESEDEKTRDARDGEKACHYCGKRGHLKADCYALKRKDRPQVKPAAFVAPVSDVRSLSPVHEIGGSLGGVDEAYRPFVEKGYVSLVGSSQKVPVTILRDTAALGTYILESVLPFCAKSATGDAMLSRGMGMSIISSPTHKIELECGLVNGEVEVALRAAFPMAGVDVVLGNMHAGGRVWANKVLPQPLVSPIPIVDSDPDKSELDFPQVCSAHEMEPDEVENSEAVFSLSDVPISVSQTELIAEQQSDPSIRGLFEGVLTGSEVKDSARGYFLDNGLLVRKYVPCGEPGTGEPAFQVVVPTKYRDLVLQLSHDQSGHWGVKKTYRRILQYFFWPLLKKDVAKYIKTCHTCQRSGKPNQVIKPAPLHPINATPAQVKMKRSYDRRAERREFSPDDQVLALLPIVTSPFQAKFSDPHTVVEKSSDENDVISNPNWRKPNQLCHVKLLNPCFPVFGDILSQKQLIEHDRYDQYCLDIRHSKCNVLAAVCPTPLCTDV